MVECLCIELLLWPPMSSSIIASMKGYHVTHQRIALPCLLIYYSINPEL